MEQLIEEMRRIERIIARKKGSLSLCGLFLREDSPDRWDLIVAAPWVEENRSTAVKYVAGLLTKRLTPDELILISRIVPLGRSDPGVQAIVGAINVVGGVVHIRDSSFNDLVIKEAYIITAQRVRLWWEQ